MRAPGEADPAGAATFDAPEWRVRDLLQALPAAIYVTDADGRITYYNEAAASLWGCRPALGSSAWCAAWRLCRPDGAALAYDESPMAMALKHKRAIRGMEAVAERPDGSRVSFMAFPSPLFRADGTLAGAVNLLVDFVPRQRAEESEMRLAAIIDSSFDAIVSKDLDGIVQTWNQSAERLFGYTAAEMIGRPIATLIPADHADEEPKILTRIRRGERVDHYETVRRRKDGSLVEISLTVSPIRNAAGRIVGASKVARDITERRRAEEQRRLLLREMSHRVKNLFAVAGAVVSLTGRFADTPHAMARAIRERLAALARTYELARPGLIDEQGEVTQEMTLQALLDAILLPYAGPHAAPGTRRYSLQGSGVSIGSNSVTSLALVLHEFATNAAKYGALSTPDGWVAIDWSNDEGSELRLTWRERGGPPIAGPPTADGFGTILTSGVIVDQLGGRLSRDWNRDGLLITLAIPMERLAPAPADGGAP